MLSCTFALSKLIFSNRKVKMYIITVYVLKIGKNKEVPVKNKILLLLLFVFVQYLTNKCE